MVPPSKLRRLFSNKFLIRHSTRSLPVSKLCFPLNHKYHSLAFQGEGLLLIPGYLVWDLCGQIHSITGFSLETFSVANYYSTSVPCLYASILIEATKFRFALSEMSVKMLMLMTTVISDSEHIGGPNS
jgi:hypothetical protein